ncbi:MAG TPA: hypothetical protein VF515_11270 [Candidatus Binatia bacterium]|jgi:hypothetical protein
MRGRRMADAALLYVALALVQGPGAAWADAVRRLFEPTDLEFEQPGVVELDTQFGPVRGEKAHRIAVPDVELDLGLTRNVEFDLDGQFAIGGPDSGAFRFDRVAPDNLWPAVKLGLADFAESGADVAWAAGLQVGPKLPLARGAHGVGIEGLLLLGCRYRQTAFILNLGGRRDPAADDAPGPSAAEFGIDIDHPLDAAGHWALLGEIGAVAYVSPDPNQLTTSAGIAWRPSDDLELSVTGLYGWLAGGDQYGVLFGFSPKFHLW